MSHDLEHSPGPADQAVANAYDSFAEAYAAETESNLINGYYTRPAVLDLAGDVAGRRILDVGCGAGPLLAALRERGAVITGVDSSTKMLELARQRLGEGADLHPADVSLGAVQRGRDRQDPWGQPRLRLSAPHWRQPLTRPPHRCDRFFSGVFRGQLHRSIVEAAWRPGHFPGRRDLVSEVLGRLRDAQNRHDLDAFVACFDPQYRSEQPLHPDRAFVGRQQVRTNWAEVFAGVPDFQAELLRSAEQNDTGWAEWHWHGTRTDGTRLEMRGVTIFGVRGDRIIWGRLYLEDVEGGQGIDQAVQHMARGPE